MGDEVGALAAALALTPAPFVIRRGTSAGDGEVLWGDPEPGSYTSEQQAETVITALAAAGWYLSRAEPLTMERLARALHGIWHSDHSKGNHGDWCLDAQWEPHATAILAALAAPEDGA